MNFLSEKNTVQSVFLAAGSVTFLFLCLAAKALFAFLNQGLLDTLALGESNTWVLAFTNDENVVLARSEGVSLGVLDVGDVVGTSVALNVLEDTNTADIVSS